MLTAAIASLVQGLLGWAGIEALRHGALLYVPGTFAYEIGIGCTGIVPAVALTAAILATPRTGGQKGWGLAAGVALVLTLNLLRLAHLFALGVRAPRLFEQAHRYWWEAALVAVTFAAWLAWSCGTTSARFRHQAVEQLDQRL